MKKYNITVISNGFPVRVWDDVTDLTISDDIVRFKKLDKQIILCNCSIIIEEQFS